MGACPFTESIYLFRGLVDELPLTAVKKKEGEINYVREELDVSQGKLVLGCRTCISYKDDEYLALLMYDGILGGFPIPNCSRMSGKKPVWPIMPIRGWKNTKG